MKTIRMLWELNTPEERELKKATMFVIFYTVFLMLIGMPNTADLFAVTCIVVMVWRELSILVKINLKEVRERVDEQLIANN